jgi:hypothetical protein
MNCDLCKSRQKLELTLVNLVNFVAKRRHVTYVELQHYFDGAEGDYSLDLTHNLSVMMGVSIKLIDLVKEALMSKKLFLNPSSLIVHLADGGIPNVPILTRMPKKALTKPHWFPTVLDTQPSKIPSVRKIQEATDRG